ncbi:MAG: ABC transporter ATP-binding protein, partial [Caldilineaceae bacterium]|nr:ABC transporter ATP-binding protein [Caldilineaceae bacterium]
GAMNSLNPVMRISKQIADAIETHEGRIPSKELKERIIGLLSTVGLPSRVYNMFPHELSGGMKQRACIAMAIALHPSLVIADEPTSALDVVVQRVVGETLLDVKERLGVSMIIIGHDMGLMAQFASRMAVMYAGSLVELGTVKDIFTDALHAYTEMLIESLPTIGNRGIFKGIPGITPLLRDLPPGCVFNTRCPKVMDICYNKAPAYREHQPGHFVACHLHENGEKQRIQYQQRDGVAAQ